MAAWKCNTCGHVIEGRCKPGKCPNCGAPKTELVKQEKAKEA
ncbi:MAG: radical SAM protein [Firmicutes bacterium]|nr:radical SAM protein [Bacillota bacterium]MCL5039170.1 radical SAM protein [Bacillota bacterium]